MKPLLCWLAALLLASVATPVDARIWTDNSGKYTLDAELVGFDDDQVILQRATDKALGAVSLDRLSDADRDYLASEEGARSGKRLDEPQIWTLRNGLKVPGRVVDFVSKEVTVQRRRGRVYVNDRAFENLPEIYQRIVPKVIGHYEQNQVQDAKSLTAWLVHRKGAPQSYSVDGVVLEIDTGDEYSVPFFLFSEKDLAVLKPGWDAWAATAGDYDRQQDTSFELQSLAAAYQKNADVNRQIAQIQLGLQAVDAGVTSLWEVTLYPTNGSAPLWVVVPGRDSRVAQANALQQNPGCQVGPVRRVSN
ncbi:SHD1 domain-containing protein [Botrimarina hoheduenensis]|uniref:SLA1 homology domain-containing protein n=1 Tax=Botrimarina hoheduenensis TaxID=2528000 RepID=A0A5C5VXT8_9BACT|nr:SHD1 domain-containing protein [Botrimarina hoheduenensis]TWT42957.1 hypothetical protein Pla111_25950 [Botrimarina hoheduenensis]